ncbi:MAG: AtpZ/AtpI family protein [Betaproteobacteria bacterium]
MKDLISTRLLKIVAIWSLVPTYTAAGGAIGYGLDRWLTTFPYLTGAGILIAFGFAVRDMMRLKREW